MENETLIQEIEQFLERLKDMINKKAKMEDIEAEKRNLSHLLNIFYENMK